MKKAKKVSSVRILIFILLLLPPSASLIILLLDVSLMIIMVVKYYNYEQNSNDTRLNTKLFWKLWVRTMEILKRKKKPKTVKGERRMTKK